MDERINWLKYVVKEWTKNVNFWGAESNKLATEDYVRLPSASSLRKRDPKERKKSVTDFALINFANQSWTSFADDGLLAGDYLTRDCYKEVYADGTFISRNDDDQDLGVVVQMSIDAKKLCEDFGQLVSNFVEHKDTPNGQKHFLKIGGYGKTIVSVEFQNELEQLYCGGKLKEGLECTGLLITTNGEKEYGNGFLPKQNPQFLYKGERYIRSIAWSEDKSNINNGDIVPSDEDVVWVKVEPICMEIMNWDELPAQINSNKSSKVPTSNIIRLESEQAILSGLPFNSYWQTNFIRSFLNSLKSNDFDANQNSQDYEGWDFSKSGFLFEALNETRDPVREFVIPKNQTKIADYAFAGCVGIEKINIHNKIERIGKDAFSGCDFNYVYTKKGETGIIISKQKPKEEVESLVELDIYKRAFPGFGCELVVGDFKLENLRDLADKLNKQNLRLPYAFVRELVESGKFFEFEKNCDFKFLKAEKSVDLTKRDDFGSIPQKEIASYYKFMLAFGCFSNNRIRDSKMKETQTQFAQKSINAFERMLKNGDLKVGKFCKIFNDLSIMTEPNQDLIDFLAKNNKKTRFSMIRLLTDMEDEHPNIFAKIITEFKDFKASYLYKHALANNNESSWREALIGFNSSSALENVTEQTQDIADVYAGRLSQEIFDEAARLRMIAIEKNVPEHILGKPLREKTILEVVESIKNETGELLQKSKELLDELYEKEFTFEMLSKKHPINPVIGTLATSCCASLASSIVAYGRRIAIDTVIEKDVQNLVVNDAKGKIIGKGTMYVNSEKGYIVFNDFEINQKYREYEILGKSGVYKTETEAQKRKEQQRQKIFDAIMRGVEAFVEEWDAIHPNKPIQYVTVGSGYNRLKAQIEGFKTTKKLPVPKKYNFVDATSFKQHLLYERDSQEDVKTNQIGEGRGSK